ncbi:MAG: choice-of-anchor B family protein [Marinicellaceae bacterium]
MIKKIIFTLTFIFVLSGTLNAHPFTPCDENGMADFYECDNIDLSHRIHLETFEADSGADIWGWTDTMTNKEYALMALNNGTAFIDISDPKFPIYLGKLPTHTTNSLWRDVKTYANHAYIVSEAGGHGMQIFDLTKLRNVVSPPVVFSNDAHFSGFGNAHNIVINEATGFAYATGTGRGNTGTCEGGLHMIDISSPTSPVDAGCFSDDGYTHDAQCITYNGPDTAYAGNEICFNSNENTLTIVDVTSKNNPIQISRTGYAGSQYTHQGWLTEDHRYYMMNDELDEQNNGHNTKTYIWDLVDLDMPLLKGFYSGPEASIDHNLYIKGNYAYLTNYTSGLSIIDITDIGNNNFQEVAKFDSYPDNNGASFDGAWSNYPYFESGAVIMSGIGEGLFILDPKICPQEAATSGLMVQANGDNNIDLTWTNDLGIDETYNVYRSEGGCSADNFEQIASGINTPNFSDSSASGDVTIGYRISKVNATGECETDRSICMETTTTGMCTAAPKFSGVNSVDSTNATNCGMDIKWNNANSYCNAGVSYDIYKSTDAAFIPSSENRIATAISANQFHDPVVQDSTEYYYLVRAQDVSNQSLDNNNLKLSDTAEGIIGNGDFSAGAEIGDSGFDQNRHVGWEQVDTRANSGERSYWSQSNSNTCNDLLSQTISLTPGKSSQLSFWTAYEIEPRWDGGVVEITNDEKLWNSVTLTPGYNDTFNDSTDACGYEENEPAFSGTNLNWTQHSMDLSSYQGQDIRIRWSYSTDGFENGEGWFLDDILVTNTQTPAQCIGLEDLIFNSNFDN